MPSWKSSLRLYCLDTGYSWCKWPSTRATRHTMPVNKRVTMATGFRGARGGARGGVERSDNQLWLLVEDRFLCGTSSTYQCEIDYFEALLDFNGCIGRLGGSLYEREKQK